ncbi:hypothetical protein [Campylobacter sp.]|uniref:hypothetical protein n=1 Tax=Campylobacter sp. TaxID=205 RepID=UPI002708E0B3|nr:hypothetical protein [Campylobacter sp.]
MRKIFVAVMLAVLGFGESLDIRDFETDLYSRDAQNSIKKVSVSLLISGRDVQDNEAYILDGLNVVIGSFYVEDLLTSRGKEKFKETFAKYTSKKHSVDIDEVLIISLKIVREPKLEELLDLLKDQKKSELKSRSKKEKSQNEDDDIIIQKGGKIELKPLDLNSIKDFGKDFGE